MNNSGRREVFITSSSLFCAAGEEVETILDCIKKDVQNLQPTPFPFEAGEGTAFLGLSYKPVEDDAFAVRVGGYGRSFSSHPAKHIETHISCMKQALTMAGILPEEVDWIMFDSVCAGEGREMEIKALEKFFCKTSEKLPLGGHDHVCGFLGPASPILNTIIAFHGIKHGCRTRVDINSRFIKDDDITVRNVLINASGFQGQFTSILICAGEKYE